MQTQHIIVGTDFSPAAEAALDRVIELAGTSGCRITLVHVCEIEAELAIFDEQRWAKPRVEQLRRCHARLAAAVARKANAGVEIAWLLATGRPWEKLEDLAIQTDATAIAIGRTGDSLGVVAKHLLRRATCPVLCVPLGEYVMTRAEAV